MRGLSTSFTQAGKASTPASDVFLGLDIGKGEYHATAVTPADKNAFDKRLPNTEPKFRELFAKLQASTEECWSWSTSRPRLAPCCWWSPGTWAARADEAADRRPLPG